MAAKVKFQNENYDFVSELDLSIGNIVVACNSGKSDHCNLNYNNKTKVKYSITGGYHTFEIKLNDVSKNTYVLELIYGLNDWFSERQIKFIKESGRLEE